MKYQFPPHKHCCELSNLVEISETGEITNKWSFNWDEQDRAFDTPETRGSLEELWKHFGLEAPDFPFPAHFFLLLNHNTHLSFGDTIEEWACKEAGFGNEEAMQRSLSTNEIWTLSWQPKQNNHNQLYIAAPTIEELFAYLQSDEIEAEIVSFDY